MSNETFYGAMTYNVGLADQEFTLLIKMIDDEQFTDHEEIELDGLRKKLVHKRKQLRRRERGS